MPEISAVPDLISIRTTLMAKLTWYKRFDMIIFRTLFPPILGAEIQDAHSFGNLVQLLPASIRHGSRERRIGSPTRAEIFFNVGTKGARGMVVFDQHRNPLLFVAGAKLGLGKKTPSIEFTKTILEMIGVPNELFDLMNSSCIGSSSNYLVKISRENTLREVNGDLSTIASATPLKEWTWIK